jgi:hypothetical protein
LFGKKDSDKVNPGEYTDKEQTDAKREIATFLYKRPYAFAAILIDFTEKKWLQTYAENEENYHNVAKATHVTMFDQIEFVMWCAEHMSDFEINTYIKQTEGRICKEV